MSRPLVSVVIPAWNSARYLVDALESALGQSWPRCQVIVVDDGSTDETPEILERYRGRVSCVRQERAGGGAARNHGIRKAEGDYIALLDHDDHWHPQKIETQVEVATRNAESGLVACDGVQFEGEEILCRHLLAEDVVRELAAEPSGERTARVYRRLLGGNIISTPSQTLIPRAVIERLGPLSEAVDEAYDYEYYLRLSLRHPITFHAHSLARWRYHGSSRSGPEEERMLRWTVMDLPVLRRQLRSCAAEDRRLVRRALRRREGRARLAYEFARRHDGVRGRAFLRQIAWRAPFAPRVWPWLLAGHLPGGLWRAAPSHPPARGSGAP